MKSEHDLINKDVTETLLNFTLESPERYSDKREPVQDRIYRLLTREKFRFGKISDEISTLLKDRINSAIKNNQPIFLSYPMGGCKGINTLNFPNINWAEVFAFKFLFDNLNIIPQIYEPGIKIEFSTDDFAVRVTNNYKKEWTDIYREQFLSLIKYFNKNTPPNFTFSLTTGKDFYEFEKLKEKIIQRALEIQKDKERSNEIVSNWKRRAINNIYLPEDLPQDEKEQMIEFSTLLNTAWLDYDFEQRGDYLSEGTHIPIVNFKDFPGAFIIRVIKGSTVQFWKGNGVFQINTGNTKPLILSRKEYKSLPIKEKVEIKSNLTEEIKSLYQAVYTDTKVQS